MPHDTLICGRPPRPPTPSCVGRGGSSAGLLLRASPALRRYSGSPPPLPPLPALRAGGVKFPCRAGVAVPPFPPWLPQLLPPGCRPLALLCSAGVESLVHCGRLYLRHQSGGAPTARRAESSAIAALSRPCCLRSTPLVGCVCHATTYSDRKGLPSGGPLAAPPVFKCQCTPHGQSRNVDPRRQRSPRAEFAIRSPVSIAEWADRLKVHIRPADVPQRSLDLLMTEIFLDG